MTPSLGTFPFGQPLRRVLQGDGSPKLFDRHELWVREIAAGVLQAPKGSR